MDILWPGFLLLLGLIPLIIAVYIWILRRRRRFAVRYSSLALVREALPQQSLWRRHLPFALFLLALASLMVALARPVAIVSVPAGRATIILAMDVSRSMCSTDIPPNRLQAAQDAAQSFIQRQESSTQIGIVVFAGFAELIQPPTTDQEVLQDAVESLTTARRTAVGNAILESLDAIAEINPSVAPSVTGLSPEVEITPVPEGVYAPDIIVILTDGASNAGPWPLEAAQQAVDRGVRVYTIGFGTAQGSIMNCSPQYQNGGLFGGGGGGFGFGGGGGFRRGIDEDTLMRIADMTGGTYYSAESAGELQDVFENLPTYLITRQETTEISVAFAAVGAVMAALAILLSLIWHPLP
ncbi:MAG TPA: VWA domain-containing protein [Anaerolineae bacterium]